MVPQQPNGIDRAILRTVAYGDIFEHALSLPELRRYLEKVPADDAAVLRAAESLSPERLVMIDDMFCLPGRESLVEVRHRRRRISERMWPEAIRCGHAIARLPFVRMVALTGALAMDNVEEDGDLDYLVVTEPGRVWLSRWVIVQLVRVNRWLHRVVICPNWILASDSLALERQDFYAARELTQMVPLAGAEEYRRMRRLNAWSGRFLPNADDEPRTVPVWHGGPSTAWRIGESLLRTPVGSSLEKLEQRRKSREIRRLGQRSSEVVLDSRQCKGHVDAHGQRIALEYEKRLRQLGLFDH